MDDKINLLIRNGYRPELFKRCLDSINAQSYENISLIIGADTPEALAQNIETRFPFSVINLDKKEIPFYWNLHCNALKNLVNDGVLCFVDNDDWLTGPNVIEQIMSHFDDRTQGMIVQFMRGKHVKPNTFEMENRIIKLGRIGGGCLLLRAEYKEAADWDNEGYGADYRWIKKVSEKVRLKFVSIPFQIADQKNFGR